MVVPVMVALIVVLLVVLGQQAKSREQTRKHLHEHRNDFTDFPPEPPDVEDNATKYRREHEQSGKQS